ncbi:helix-turn-helix domain-containing protein [Actinomadura sp. WAC 06369]|uniref:helix-turn-helix domain-containing protein n=1 Tax=Actinomadura sp. WAC 06369 TaxID=2203193 RepID=UPI0013157C49|nr:helix-turn-helix transcriptional regulator [Actinomadura sp. WAC 06369]
MDAQDTAGARIATFRRLRGMSQRELAQKAAISLSLLSKVETGNRPATPAVISATARELKIDIAQITGQPFAPDTPTDAQVHEHVAVLRRELAAYNLPPTAEGQPRSIEDLTADVAKLANLRHGVNLLKLGEHLPKTLEALRFAAHAYEGSIREQVYGLLAEGYAAAGQLAYKMGYIDLSALTTDRYEWAAERSGDPLCVHIGDYLRAGELMMAGDTASAAALMDASLGRLEPHLGGRGSNWQSKWAVWGNLHLKAALVAARSGRGDAELSAWQYYEQAKTAADEIGEDRDDYRLYFGPTNVRIWAVSLAVELCDDAGAIGKAEDVHLPSSAPSERRSHHWIDLARAHVWRNDPGNALQCLYEARDIAPQHARFHPQVRETAQQVARMERQTTGTLRSFASWLGMND